MSIVFERPSRAKALIERGQATLSVRDDGFVNGSRLALVGIVWRGRDEAASMCVEVDDLIELGEALQEQKEEQ